MNNLLRNTRLFMCIYLTSSIDIQAGFARRAATICKRAIAGATLAATGVAMKEGEAGEKTETENNRVKPWLIRVVGYNNDFGPQNHHGLGKQNRSRPRIEHDSVGILHKCPKGASYCTEGQLVIIEIAVLNNDDAKKIPLDPADEHGPLTKVSLGKGMRKEDADYIREILQALNRYEKPYVIINSHASSSVYEVKKSLCEALLLEIRPEQPVERSIPCHKDGKTYMFREKNPKHQGFIIVIDVSREELAKFLEKKQGNDETCRLQEKSKPILAALIAKHLPNNGYEIVAIHNETDSTTIIPAPPIVITPDLMQGTAKIIKVGA